jgi:hypothetical protein
MKRLLKIADNIFNVWIVHFICYNLWFGFNVEPITDAEIFQDRISTYVLTVVFIAYMLAFFKIIRHYVDNNTLK